MAGQPTAEGYAIIGLRLGNMNYIRGKSSLRRPALLGAKPCAPWSEDPHSLERRLALLGAKACVPRSEDLCPLE